MKYFFLFSFFCFSINLSAQHWQQKVDYTMDINMDVDNSTYKGTQVLKYKNNSPDVLTKAFFHLYPNAFQPNSAMDMRLKNIKDPDQRMVTAYKEGFKSRISDLKENEIGYLKPLSLTQNGKPVDYSIEGTVLEVILNKPIKAGKSCTFKMEFLGQVPKQIRRSGRNNKEGVALSMTQWYPKLAEYDQDGWHADPYIAREFYGAWGSFDVTIHIDKNYTIGGTGVLQNPKEIGHSYINKKVKHKTDKLSWHFKANNVHDFAWAADKNFIHETTTAYNGTVFHYFYKKDLSKKQKKAWTSLMGKTSELLAFYNTSVGNYPYSQYSIIQGGDGGMEYPMCTLVTGQRSFGSLFGTVAHEMAHSWFQGVIATDESQFPWMDEGFTTYISTLATCKILGKSEDEEFNSSYLGYKSLVKNNIQEPLSTHADDFKYNYTYSISSYSKGALFLRQLEYVIGKKALENTLKTFYSSYKFQHPTPQQFIRVAEKESNLVLDWYLNNWIYTTKSINYEVSNIKEKTITLKNKGRFSMPIDIRVTFKDGSQEDYHIPKAIMRGHKKTEATILPDWSWTSPNYQFTTEKEIDKVEIDPLHLMCDVDREDNIK